MSPDTDVYHIGCPLQSTSSPKHVVLQINKLIARELRYLDLNALKLALQKDSDLSHLESATLPRALQTLYLSTGCDYISFFSKIGKSTIFRYFFQYTSFITSGNNQQTPGTLSDIGLTDNSYLKGYLSLKNDLSGSLGQLILSYIQQDSKHHHLSHITRSLLTQNELLKSNTVSGWMIS